jgi:hypothetical protein
MKNNQLRAHEKTVLLKFLKHSAKKAENTHINYVLAESINTYICPRISYTMFHQININ